MSYHKVIPMETFMDTVAKKIWPVKMRTGLKSFLAFWNFKTFFFLVFCYVARGKSSGCNAKEGNPFGPFWDTFNVDFTHSEFYGPLNYDVHYQNMALQWNQKYPSNQWPGKYIDPFFINYNALFILKQFWPSLELLPAFLFRKRTWNFTAIWFGVILLKIKQ